MKKVYIIGAGQLGSRHLQALKAVKTALDIKVVDPFEDSLKVAQERYEGIPGAKHQVQFLTEIPKDIKNVDLAIVATNSDVRRKVIESLLATSKVRFLILEKLLFNKKADYQAIESLFVKYKSKVWVNCSMRSMPFYYDLKKNIDPVFTYVVTGSQYGLVTNAIHYIDHMAFLSGCFDFEVNIDGLDPKPIKSKRKDFLELNGRLDIHFKNGSQGIFVCYSDGSAPVQVEIYSKNYRCISRESEQKAWISKEKDNWQWQEIKAEIPFQSQRTAKLVTDILKKSKCVLPEYDEAVKLHLPLLEALRQFLEKKTGKKFDNYPFT